MPQISALPYFTVTALSATLLLFLSGCTSGVENKVIEAIEAHYQDKAPMTFCFSPVDGPFRKVKVQPINPGEYYVYTAMADESLPMKALAKHGYITKLDYVEIGTEPGEFWFFDLTEKGRAEIKPIPGHHPCFSGSKGVSNVVIVEMDEAKLSDPNARVLVQFEAQPGNPTDWYQDMQKSQSNPRPMSRTVVIRKKGETFEVAPGRAK